VKQYFFLSGLPRAGNTLLGSLLNQNKNIDLTSNTLLCDILLGMHNLKDSEIFKNFPDEKSLDNIYNNILNNYFMDWKADNIIIRGPWGTPGNLFLLKKIIKKPKHIILYRPIEECLASFIKTVKPKDKVAFIKNILNERGILGHSLISIKNIVDKEKDYIVIYYDDLVSKTEKQIKKIYDFLDLPYQKVRLKNIDVFKSNNIKYNDTVLAADLHKIRTKDIKKNTLQVKKLLDKDTINQCRKMEIF
jgi:hypothetical protein